MMNMMNGAGYCCTRYLRTEYRDKYLGKKITDRENVKLEK